jgi:hypothetical protein
VFKPVFLYLGFIKTHKARGRWQKSTITIT